MSKLDQLSVITDEISQDLSMLLILLPNLE